MYYAVFMYICLVINFVFLLLFVNGYNEQR